MHSSEDDEGGIDGYIKKIDKYLHGKEEIGNGTQYDFSQPIVRDALEKYLPFLFFFYGLLMLSGISGNIILISYIVKQKLYHNETHGFIINIALCNILQCSFVLPITILIIVLQNWIFGQFLCFFVPMLQDIPIHVLVITNLILAWDRLRWLRDPFKIRLPSFVCGCGTWITGLIIALPYPIYTTYIDLGIIFPERYQGVGVCAVNILDDKLDEYMRTLFVVMYFAPSVVLSYIHIRTATELQTPMGPLAVMMFEAKAELRFAQNGCSKINGPNGPNNVSKPSYNLYDAEIDLTREQRSQRHISGISASNYICLCPLMILRLARMNVPETYENTLHYDLCFLMFIWISLLPAVITPIIFFSWKLSRPTKDYIKSLLSLQYARKNKIPVMELYVNDESSSIKPDNIYAPEINDTLNYQRNQDTTNETTFDTSDMSYKSYNKFNHNVSKEFKNIKMIIGNKKQFNIEKMMKKVNSEQTNDNIIAHDTNIYYASTSSTSCSLHEANDASTYQDESLKNNYMHSSYRKPYKEILTPIEKELQHKNLDKCTNTRTWDIEIIASLDHERSIRDIDNDEKYNYDSNKRISLLPNQYRRESGASNSSIRYLISNNNSPVLEPSKNSSKNLLKCSYNTSSTRSNSILENYTLHSNTVIDNNLTKECYFENSRINAQNSSKEFNRHYKVLRRK